MFMPFLCASFRGISIRTILSNALESTIDTFTQAGQNKPQWLKEYDKKFFGYDTELTKKYRLLKPGVLQIRQRISNLYLTL